MVRGSSLSFRLCCLRNGADVVFSPGITDIPLSKAERRVEGNVIKFYTKSNDHDKVVFQTCEEEKGKIVLQLVSNDPEIAIPAVKLVENDVSAIDLNCGCPEKFAVHRGCGSAIDLDSASKVVSSICASTKLPISVKCRVLKTPEETIQFTQAMEKAGASAIILHGRLAENKRHGEIDFDHMKTVFQALHCVTIGNGGVESFADAQAMKEKTGCSSVMICSAALRNPSVFSPTPSPPELMMKQMSGIGRMYDECFGELKWNLQQVVSACKNASKAASIITQSKTYDELLQNLEQL